MSMTSSNVKSEVLIGPSVAGAGSKKHLLRSLSWPKDGMQ